MDLLNAREDTFLTGAKGITARNLQGPEQSRSVLGSVDQLRLTAEIKHKRQLEERVRKVRRRESHQKVNISKSPKTSSVRISLAEARRLNFKVALVGSKDQRDTPALESKLIRD